MVPLLSDTLLQHRELASGTDAESFICGHPYAFGYHTIEAFNGDLKWWDLRAGLGIRFDVIDGKDYGVIDPLFPDQFKKWCYVMVTGVSLIPAYTSKHWPTLRSTGWQIRDQTGFAVDQDQRPDGLCNRWASHHP